MSLRNAQTIKEFIVEFSKVSTSRRQGMAYKTLLDALRAFISLSKKVEKVVGECPALRTKHGCPFKSVKLSDGKPLVSSFRSTTSTCVPCDLCWLINGQAPSMPRKIFFFFPQFLLTCTLLRAFVWVFDFGLNK